MATKNHFVAAMLFIVLTSCTVGPDYRAPGPALPAGYGDGTRPLPNSEPTTNPTTQASVISSEAQPVGRWWTTLHDAELDSLIDRAVAGNLDLQQAGSRVLESRAQLRIAGDTDLPKLDARGAFARIDSGKNGNPVGNGSIVTNIWQAGFDASWEIDLFGGQRREIEAAKADFQAAVEDRRDALVSLTAEVARDYYEMRGYQQRLRYARRNLGLQQDTLALTQSLRNAGFNSALDVSRAQTLVSQTQAQIIPLTTDVRQRQHAIATLLGLEPGALVVELDPGVPLQTLPPVVSIGMPADLLRRRPDIRRAERQITAANARVGAAVAGFYPKFSLTGDFGLDATQFHHLFDWESRYFLIYPSIDWRLFDFGRTAASVQQEKERTRQTLLAYQGTVLTALREVEDALVAYSNEQDHHAALAAAVESARESVDISRDQYKQGIIDFLPVLDAQRQLLSAQDELAQSDQTLSTNLVALYKAIGGGWDADEPNQPRAVVTPKGHF
jgi:multidrug efflux system outer membrane protein